jgi:hypothetical protein
MKRFSIWSGLFLALAVLLLSFAARSSPPTSAPPSAPVASGEPASLQCTVRSVDLRARTVDVITGVGYALRQYRMKVAPACEISVAGAEADLGSLRPGAIVRVRYQPVPAAPKVPAHLMAVGIEVVRPDEMGGAR